MTLKLISTRAGPHLDKRTTGNLNPDDTLAGQHKEAKTQPDEKERSVQMPKEYTSVVIDKANVGLRPLQLAVAENGLQTAEMLGIQLAPGSVRLEHHQHVFMWDDSTAGVRGRTGIEQAGNCFLVRIRWMNLSETGTFFAGTLMGDSGHNGPPAGTSTNGAWAFRGAIPWQYCYVDGLDRADIPGFRDWRDFRGWPAGQQTRHR